MKNGKWKDEEVMGGFGVFMGAFGFLWGQMGHRWVL